MRLKNFLHLLFALLAFGFCANEEEVFYEVSLIHENAKKNVLLNKWESLVEEALELVKEKNNITDKDFNESHLTFWHSSGEKLHEAIFKTDKFRKGSKHVFVFISTEFLDSKCFSKENIYRKLGGEIEKYKSLFFNIFSMKDKKSSEWIALEEVLNLLFKSRDLRHLVKNLNTDADIELLRQKIIELTGNNEFYKPFVDVLKENETIFNILKDSEAWNTFVKSNYENLKNIIDSYTEEKVIEL